jgi:uncharacterized cupredoxin-like copper-binding protein
VLLALALVVLPLVTSSCGQPADSEPVGGPVTRVLLRDFHITAPSAPIKAGDVRLMLINRGPTVHELVLARTELRASKLPIGPDGLSVSEHDPAVKKIDEVPEVRLHQRVEFDVHLRPGHYVLFCNLEGHYLSGMHQDLTVVR